jgi:Fur family ferric uptake transcriptional regulator
MTQANRLDEALHNSGRRLTRQRQLVLEILEESQEHLDAEAIFERARKRDARVGLATVYRTLAFLKEIGLVDEYQFGEGHGHFEAVKDDSPHNHFTCMKCGRVIEFQSPQVMDMAHKLCESEGLQLVEVNLHFSGYCTQCRPVGTNCE